MINKKVGGAFVEIGADFGLLDNGLKTLESKMRSFGKKLNRIGDNVGRAGAGLLAVGAAITAPLVLAVRTGLEFQRVMATTQGITRLTAKEMGELAKQAKFLGSRSLLNETEIAKGQKALLKGGLDLRKTLANLPALLDFAGPNEKPIEDAAELLADVAGIFKLEDFRHVGDVLTRLTHGTRQNIDDMAESIKFAAKEAGFLNLSLEATAVLIGVQAQAGQRGSIAGTGFRQLANKLTSPKVVAELKSKDISIEDSVTKGLRDPIDILLDYQDVLKGQDFSITEIAGKINELFDIRGGASAKSVFVQLGSEIKRIRGIVDDADGTTKAFSDLVKKSLPGSIDVATNAFRGLSLALTEAVTPSLLEVTLRLPKVFRLFVQIIKTNKELVITLLKVTTAIIGTGAALIGIAVILKASGIAFGVVAGAIKLIILTPVIAGVTVLITLLAATADELLKFFKLPTTGLSDFIKGFRVAGQSIGAWIEIGLLEAQVQFADFIDIATLFVASLSIVFATLRPSLEQVFKSAFAIGTGVLTDFSLKILEDGPGSPEKYKKQGERWDAEQARRIRERQKRRDFPDHYTSSKSGFMGGGRDKEFAGMGKEQIKRIKGDRAIAKFDKGLWPMGQNPVAVRRRAIGNLKEQQRKIDKMSTDSTDNLDKAQAQHVLNAAKEIEKRREKKKDLKERLRLAQAKVLKKDAGTPDSLVTLKTKADETRAFLEKLFTLKAFNDPVLPTLKDEPGKGGKREPGPKTFAPQIPGEARGTFSALALSGIGESDKMVEAQKETNKLLTQMEKNTRDLKDVFDIVISF